MGLSRIHSRKMIRDIWLLIPEIPIRNMYTERIRFVYILCQQIFFFVRRFSFFFLFCRSVWESFPFCRIVRDFFLFLSCFSFVASESSFFVGQTFWSSLSFL
ncbi:unnamed protein product [Rhizophagus irregularis]|nr:unnamed protein product [Rhizophagus irregularis]